jgi:hypothetical protein
MPNNEEQTKECSRCGQEKPLSGFHKNKRYRLGVRPECKTCKHIPAIKPKLNIYSNCELTIKSPTHGDYIVLYDPEDEQLLKQYKWRLHRCGKNGQKERAFYVIAHIPCPSGEWVVWGGINRRKLINLSMHRLINNTPKGSVTDHINGNTLDNRKVNLRSANQSENCYNRGKMSNNTSGYVGVCWDKATGQWRAAVHGSVSGVKKALWSTRFDDKIKAAVARDKALCALVDIISPERQLNFPERYEEYMADLKNIPE